ncbi:hypothetical protein [Streptomyces sediminimaris]|uniref:hypothetical protein n=1 Tax=Streptomyces sediminimaris TaxID=3383721 RepID=UPI00399AD814
MTQHDGNGARSTPGRLEYERAIRRSDLPPPSRHLALTIATWANIETGIIPDRFQPAKGVLEESTGLSRGAIVKHLNVLESNGWIGRETGGGAGRRTKYRLCIPHAETGHVVTPSGSENGSRHDPFSENGSSSDPKTGHVVNRNGSPRDPKSPSQSRESLSLAERVVRDAGVVADDERETFISWLQDKHQIRGIGWWKTVTKDDLVEHAANWRAQRTAPSASLPPWCGACGDNHPGAEFNPNLRMLDGALCPDCHPDVRRSNAS